MHDFLHIYIYLNWYLVCRVRGVSCVIERKSKIAYFADKEESLISAGQYFSINSSWIFWLIKEVEPYILYASRESNSGLADFKLSGN
jgi:hypothetical protein